MGAKMAGLGDSYMRFVLRKPLTPGRAGRAIAFVTAAVTIVCGVVIRLVDHKDFDSVWLGLWWAVQTVTTVGYGDVVPTQGGARVIAAMLMLSGIGFVTVVTAVITAAFLETIRRRLGDPGHAEVLAKLEELNARLQSLESGLRR
jgi:voltage-gated potassium channel